MGNHQSNPTVYIMANKRNGTLYTGITSDLLKRIYEHKHGKISGFTQIYRCTMLVYYEQCGNIIAAIEREKKIKGGSRKKKLALIEGMNPHWQDLYEHLF